MEFESIWIWLNWIILNRFKLKRNEFRKWIYVNSENKHIFSFWTSSMHRACRAFNVCEWSLKAELQVDIKDTNHCNFVVIKCIFLIWDLVSASCNLYSRDGVRAEEAAQGASRFMFRQQAFWWEERAECLRDKLITVLLPLSLPSHRLGGGSWVTWEVGWMMLAIRLRTSSGRKEYCKWNLWIEDECWNKSWFRQCKSPIWICHNTLANPCTWPKANVYFVFLLDRVTKG